MTYMSRRCISRAQRNLQELATRWLNTQHWGNLTCLQGSQRAAESLASVGPSKNRIILCCKWAQGEKEILLLSFGQPDLSSIWVQGAYRLKTASFWPHFCFEFNDKKSYELTKKQKYMLWRHCSYKNSSSWNTCLKTLFLQNVLQKPAGFFWNYKMSLSGLSWICRRTCTLWADIIIPVSFSFAVLWKLI